MAFSNLGLQEPSTITARVATVTVARGSTTEHQEIMVIGDPTSSNGIAAVSNAAPSTSAFGLNVRTVDKVQVVNSSAADLNVTVAGYSTIATVSQLLDSSGGSVAMADSANSALRVSVVAGSVVVSTVQGKVAVVNSSAADFNVTVAGYSTVVTVAALPLISSGVVAGNSSALTVRNVWSSTNTDQPVSAAQAGTWNIGTVTTVSSVAGIVAVRPSDTNWASSAGFHFNSSGEMLVKDAAFSTIVTIAALPAGLLSTVTVNSNSSALLVRVVDGPSSAANFKVTANNADGAGNLLESSTSMPSTGARGLLVRPILGGIQTYSASTTGQSSATTIVSSAATSRGFVFALQITSTLAGPVQWAIYDGATQKWGGVLAAVSSAVSGVTLSVSPPAYLFSGSTGQPLTFNVASSNTGLNVSLAYWQST